MPKPRDSRLTEQGPGAGHGGGGAHGGGGGIGGGGGLGAGAGAAAVHATPLEGVIGHVFSDRGLLETALRHASVTDARVKSNERLEFLGDAVLGLIVCRRIYQKYPHLLEGEMTKIKSAVVSRTTCSEMAKQLGLEQYLVIGKGMKTHAELPASLGAAALEAIIAAMYLDGGIAKVEAFIEPLIEDKIDRAARSGHQENYKSILQQHAQQRLETTPEYVVMGYKGPDHARFFQICVRMAGREFEPAWGPSKKHAEQAAALNALHAMNILPKREVAGSEASGALNAQSDARDVSHGPDGSDGRAV